MSGQKVAPIVRVGGERFCAIAFSTTGSLTSLMNQLLSGTAGSLSLKLPKMLLAVNSRRRRVQERAREEDVSVGTTKLYCVFIQPAGRRLTDGRGKGEREGIGNRGMAWDRPAEAALILPRVCNKHQLCCVLVVGSRGAPSSFVPCCRLLPCPTTVAPEVPPSITCAVEGEAAGGSSLPPSFPPRGTPMGGQWSTRNAANDREPLSLSLSPPLTGEVHGRLQSSRTLRALSKFSLCSFLNQTSTPTSSPSSSAVSRNRNNLRRGLSLFGVEGQEGRRREEEEEGKGRRAGKRAAEAVKGLRD